MIFQLKKAVKQFTSWVTKMSSHIDVNGFLDFRHHHCVLRPCARDSGMFKNEHDKGLP